MCFNRSLLRCPPFPPPPFFSFFFWLLLSRFSMYSCFVHLLYLDRLSWANVIKWKGSLRSPSLFTPDLIVVVLFIYIRRELIDSSLEVPSREFSGLSNLLNPFDWSLLNLSNSSKSARLAINRIVKAKTWLTNTCWLSLLWCFKENVTVLHHLNSSSNCLLSQT